MLNVFLLLNTLPCVVSVIIWEEDEDKEKKDNVC